MGYKENIKYYEREIENLERQKEDAEKMRRNYEAGGKVSIVHTYDSFNDHDHYERKVTKTSEEYKALTEKIIKLEKEINELKEKLRIAKKMAPEEELKEKAAISKKEQKEKEKVELKKEIDTLTRKEALKEIKSSYKRTTTLPRRIALALQGRKPKWKQIKQSSTAELEFLSKAGNTTAGYTIGTRDEQIKKDLRFMSQRKNLDPDEYAEKKRREYFLKLLQAKRFLQEEQAKNSPNPKKHM